MKRPAGNRPAVVIASAHEMDNLQPITVGKSHLTQGRAGDDLAIAFDSDFRWIEFQLADKVGDTAGRGAARLTVYGQGKGGHHPRQIALNARDAS